MHCQTLFAGACWKATVSQQWYYQVHPITSGEARQLAAPSTIGEGEASYSVFVALSDWVTENAKPLFVAACSACCTIASWGVECSPGRLPFAADKQATVCGVSWLRSLRVQG